MKDKGTEIGSVVKWLEDRTVEVPSEVHFALDTIADMQPDDEISDGCRCILALPRSEKRVRVKRTRREYLESDGCDQEPYPKDMQHPEPG